MRELSSGKGRQRWAVEGLMLRWVLDVEVSVEHALQSAPEHCAGSMFKFQVLLSIQLLLPMLPTFETETWLILILISLRCVSRTQMRNQNLQLSRCHHKKKKNSQVNMLPYIKQISDLAGLSFPCTVKPTPLGKENFPVDETPVSRGIKTTSGHQTRKQLSEFFFV